MCHAPPEFKSAVSKNVYFAEAVGSMTGGQDKVRHILHTLQHILHFFTPSLPLYLFYSLPPSLSFYFILHSCSFSSLASESPS